MRRPGWKLGVAGLVALLFLAAAVVAIAGDDDPATPPAPAARSGAVTISTLRQPRGADDVLPGVARAELQSIAPVDTASEASVKATSDGDDTLYLTPTANGLCLTLVGPDGATANCMPLDAVTDDATPPASKLTGCTAPSSGTPPDPERDCSGVLVYGVAPDGVREVSIDVANGAAPHARVVNNAYMIRLAADQRPGRVRFVATS